MIGLILKYIKNSLDPITKKQNKNNLIEKMGRRSDQTFFFSYKTYRSPTGTRKELNITKHQGYANENHDELPPHSFA